MSRLGRYILCIAVVVVALFVSGTSYAIEAGMYNRYDKAGKKVSSLSIQQAGNGTWYCEMALYRSNTEEGEEARTMLDGTISTVDGKNEVTVKFLSEMEGDTLSRWSYPFYLDTKDDKMIYLTYRVLPDKKGLKVDVKKKVFPVELWVPEIKGVYVKEGDFELSKSLAAYVIETSDEELVWSFCSNWDVKEWWFDTLEAGDDVQLGNHPDCIWAEPEDGFGNKVGSYLLAKDLSMFYIDNLLIWSK